MSQHNTIQVMIVARDGGQAEECAQRNGLPSAHWNYVSCAEKLYGVYGVTVWFYGDWWRHPRAREIAEQVKTRNLGSMTAPVDSPVVTNLQQHLRNPHGY